MSANNRVSSRGVSTKCLYNPKRNVRRGRDNRRLPVSGSNSKFRTLKRKFPAVISQSFPPQPRILKPLRVPDSTAESGLTRATYLNLGETQVSAVQACIAQRTGVRGFRTQQLHTMPEIPGAAIPDARYAACHRQSYQTCFGN